MLQREWAAHYRNWKRKKHLFQMEKGGEALGGWLRTWQTICSSAITELLWIIWAMWKKPGKMYAQLLGASTWKIGKITTQDNEGLEIAKLSVYFAISLFKGDNPYHHLAYIYRRGRKLKLISQEEDSQCVLVFGCNNDRLLLEKYTGKDYISNTKLEKGDHCYIQTRHKDLFPITILF